AGRCRPSAALISPPSSCSCCSRWWRAGLSGCCCSWGSVEPHFPGGRGLAGRTEGKVGLDGFPGGPDAGTAPRAGFHPPRGGSRGPELDLPLDRLEPGPQRELGEMLAQLAHEALVAGRPAVSRFLDEDERRVGQLLFAGQDE